MWTMIGLTHNAHKFVGVYISQQAFARDLPSIVDEGVHHAKLLPAVLPQGGHICWVRHVASDTVHLMQRHSSLRNLLFMVCSPK